MTKPDALHRDPRLARLTFLWLSFVLAFQFLNNVVQLGYFQGVHWVWDYSLGFIKRGLVGASMELLLGPRANTHAVIQVAAVLVCAAVFVGYAWFAASVVRAAPSWIALAVATSGALFASALPAFAADLGRFDQIGFLIFLGCAAIALRARGPAACAAIGLTSALGVLVHEASWIVHLPTIAAILVLRLRVRESVPSRFVAWLAPACGLPLVVFAVTLALGGPSVSYDAWIRHWAEQAPFVTAEIDNALHLHYRTVEDGLVGTLTYVVPQTVLVAVLPLGCTWYLASLVLRCRALQAVARELVGYRGLAWGCAIGSPMILCLVGLDYMRWVHLTVLNAIVALLCLLHVSARRDPGGPAGSSEAWAPAVTGAVLARAVPALCAAAFLTFPQSTGVIGMSFLPNEFACIFGIPDLDPTTRMEIPSTGCLDGEPAPGAAAP